MLIIDVVILTSHNCLHNIVDSTTVSTIIVLKNHGVQNTIVNIDCFLSIISDIDLLYKYLL